jgi:chemotaxis protein CheZ
MSATAEPPSQLDALVRASVHAELDVVLDDLRRCVDQRIGEHSMAIHTSAQLAGSHERGASVVTAPVAATQSSGQELEAAVRATESAANQITAAAEAIGCCLQMVGDPTSLQVVTQHVNAIFEACTFQDLTGQRVRCAMEHLWSVETVLSGIMHPGADIDSGMLLRPEQVAATVAATPDLGPRPRTE